jgi:hypothetical protein
MHNLNYTILELLNEQHDRELASVEYRMRMEAEDRRAGEGGLRRALASRLVRLGLRLHPAAGEGLGAYDLALAGREGGTR